MPGWRFALRSVLLIAPNGQAEGVIDWRVINGMAPTRPASEWVRGSMRGSALEVKGYRVDPGIQCDHYRLALIGDDRAGVFAGRSRAWGAWNGWMHGGYIFQTGP